jgi:hypothetical protein
MRKGIGYSLVALALLGAVIGLLFALAAGGYEADALRVAGLEFLVLAAVVGVVGALILRSRR